MWCTGRGATGHKEEGAEVTEVPTPEECAVWRAQLPKLRQFYATLVGEMPSVLECLLDAVDTLGAERDEVREWLREHGRHTSTCACVCYGSGVTLPSTCTCGLDDLLGLVCGRKMEAESWAVA